jgi:mono/diheme cytochrome c family protein
VSRYGPERPPIPTPSELRETFLLRRPPAWLVYVVILVIIASFIPLALLAKARFSTSKQPRVHIIQDMDNQPRYNTQAPSDVFADGRAMRLPVAGTVARGHLKGDDHYDLGFTQVRNPETNAWEVKYFQGMPAQLNVTLKTLERGKTVYGIYCAVCHGYDGKGEGPVVQRAQAIGQTFAPPSDLHNPDLVQREDGYYYNVIRNGVRNMPAYGPQIDTEDRWAVVAYIRALQLSQNATLDDVPAEHRNSIR